MEYLKKNFPTRLIIDHFSCNSSGTLLQKLLLKLLAIHTPWDDRNYRIHTLDKHPCSYTCVMETSKFIYGTICQVKWEPELPSTKRGCRRRNEGNTRRASNSITSINTRVT